jgi:hypothetical protein
MVRDAAGGADLVHIAAFAADEVVLGALGDQCAFDRRQVLERRLGGEQGAHRHRQRGRRRQAGALRHVARDHEVHPARGAVHRFAFQQFTHHAAHVVGPHRGGQAFDRRVQRNRVHGVVVVSRHDPKQAVVALARHDHRAVADRAGQHQAVVVIGMLADQIDAARCLDLDRWWLAKRGQEDIGRAGRQEIAHRIFKWWVRSGGRRDSARHRTRRAAWRPPAPASGRAALRPASRSPP